MGKDGVLMESVDGSPTRTLAVDSAAIGGTLAVVDVAPTGTDR